MRWLFILIGCCSVGTAAAQGTNQSVRIQLSYQKAGHYVQESTEYIEAVNVVGEATNVEYKAGKSVSLLPGFEAKPGSVFLANIQPVAREIEKELQLVAFPNPFDKTTTIEYYLPTDGKVSLWVTDIQGKLVHQIVEEESQSAGIHHVEWNAQSVAPGVYLPVVESNHIRMTSRLLKK